MKKFLDKLKKDFDNGMQQKYKLPEVIVIMIITLFFGIVIGKLVFANRLSFSNSENEVVKEISDVYKTLNERYYQKIDKKALLEAAVDGMVSYLDDAHSVFYTQEAKKSLLEELNGTYNGIGIEITKNNNNEVVISKVFDDTPAAKAGLKTNDKLKMIDSEDVTKSDLSKISSLIKSKATKEVNVIVVRDGVEKSFKITKNTIDIPSVNGKMLDNDIGYIDVSIFAENTYDQFEKLLKELEKNGMKSLIIDVRNNSGGHVKSVEDILNLFVKKGKPIYQLISNDKKETVFDTTKTNKSYKVAVLINGQSASASEILASAMNEIYKSDLVGEKTFGKGTVQMTMNLSSGAMIKYTTQEWKTALGKKVDGIGVEPTFEVINKDSDNQLSKAIELLKKSK